MRPLTRRPGAGFSISIFSMPVIVRHGPTAEVMIRQWQGVYELGAKVFPALAGCTALNYFAVARGYWGRGQEWRGFAAGAVLQLAIVPFTLAFIAQVNARLLAAVDPKKKTTQANELSADGARALLQRWTGLHTARTAVALAGTAAALWNLLVVRG